MEKLSIVMSELFYDTLVASLCCLSTEFREREGFGKLFCAV